MKVLDFLARHPVFTRLEFAAGACAKPPSPKTVDAHLRHYLTAGRIGRIKRGVFFAVPPGHSSTRTPVDLLLVASRLSSDAVLAYHSALEAHGYAQSLYEEFPFLTSLKVRPLRFRGRRFIPVAAPNELKRRQLTDLFVTQIERNRLTCRVTSLERTLVDCLDRPDLAGGIEEAWRSLSAIPLLDQEALLQYVRARARATLASKVGFFLETHRQQLSVSDSVLSDLRAMKPLQAHYLVRSARGRLIGAWNLIVPTQFIENSQEAIH